MSEDVDWNDLFDGEGCECEKCQGGVDDVGEIRMCPECGDELCFTCYPEHRCNE